MTPDELKDLNFGDWVVTRDAVSGTPAVWQFICSGFAGNVWLLSPSAAEPLRTVTERIVSHHGTDRAAAEHAAKCWACVGKWYAIPEPTTKEYIIRHLVAYDVRKDKFQDELHPDHALSTKWILEQATLYSTRAEAEEALKQERGQQRQSEGPPECWQAVGKWFIDQNQDTYGLWEIRDYIASTQTFKLRFGQGSEEWHKRNVLKEACKNCEGTGEVPGPGADACLVECPWCGGGGVRGRVFYSTRAEAEEACKGKIHFPV